MTIQLHVSDIASGVAESSTVNGGRTRGKSCKNITLKEREEPKEGKGANHTVGKNEANRGSNEKVSGKGEGNGEGKSEGKGDGKGEGKGERKGDGGGEKGTMSAKNKDKEHSASSHSYSQSQGG